MIEKEMLVPRLAALTFDNKNDFEIEVTQWDEVLVKIEGKTGNEDEFAQTIFNLETGVVIYEVNGEEVDSQLIEPQSFEEWDYENWQCAHDDYSKWVNYIKEQVNYLYKEGAF